MEHQQQHMRKRGMDRKGQLVMVIRLTLSDINQMNFCQSLILIRTHQFSNAFDLSLHLSDFMLIRAEFCIYPFMHVFFPEKSGFPNSELAFQFLRINCLELVIFPLKHLESGRFDAIYRP